MRNRRIILGLYLCLCLLMTQLAFASAAERAEYKVKSLEYCSIPATAEQPELFRIEIGLDKPSEAFSVHGNGLEEKELIIELNKTRLRKVSKLTSFDGKFAEKIEFIKINNANSRVIITLPQALRQTDYKVYTLEKDKQAKKPFRIVIDILGTRFSVTKGLAGKRIVLDPGHGGSDSGAIGPGGLNEKEVTIDVAARLEELLHNAGAAVIMTRKDDRDVYGSHATDRQELQARVEVGKRNRADVFVSIHTNAFSSPKAHGTATYYYDKSPYDQLLAQALQDGMIEYGKRYDRGIVEANFYVVKRSDMPAALVELAFISNYEEQELLGSAEFRQSLAEGICKGLSNFFVQAER